MAREDFERVVRRITIDPSFAEKISKSPAEALGGLSLTSSELKAIREIDPDTLAMIVDSLDRRVRLPSVLSTNGCSGGTNGCTV
jgi:hypothetical protein